MILDLKIMSNTNFGLCNRNPNLRSNHQSEDGPARLSRWIWNATMWRMVLPATMWRTVPPVQRRIWALLVVEGCCRPRVMLARFRWQMCCRTVVRFWLVSSFFELNDSNALLLLIISCGWRVSEPKLSVQRDRILHHFVKGIDVTCVLLRVKTRSQEYDSL